MNDDLQSTQSDFLTRKSVSRRALLGGALALPLAATASRLIPRGISASETLPRFDLITSNLKPIMTGLVYRDAPTGQGYPASLSGEVAQGLVTGIVINLNWADLEASSTSSSSLSSGAFTWSALSAAMTLAQGLGFSRYPTQPWARLRISMGQGAPSDLIGGNTRVSYIPTYYDTQANSQGTYNTFALPIWWKDPYLTRAKLFLAALQAQVDSDARIADVTFSAPCTIYSEWPIRQITGGTGSPQSAANISTLLAKGYSTAADEAALSSCLGFYGAFRTTRVTFADSMVWNDLSSSGAVTADPTWHAAFLKSTRASGSPFVSPFQAIHGTNNLNNNVVGTPTYSALTALFAGNPGPVSFQTATLDRITAAQNPSGKSNLYDAIHGAVTNLNAMCIELPKGYDTVLASTDMTSLNSALAANAASYE